MFKKKSFSELFYVSSQRSQIVRKDIAEGSEPGLRFYIMVVVSTMIAGFGLVTNSTAVIIGAMLVAPLMTPIFGLSLALIRNDGTLLANALQAEIAGVAAAIGMGYLLGSIYPGLEPTPEMLVRTNPQLFDLLVAIFSGFAGAYALVDEKISPALPGVAIATAIVPPLANTGLCFAVGAWSGGIGSFLLFFSNFLSILLIGGCVFSAFKLTSRGEELDTKTVAKRFGLAIVSFILMGTFLSNSLYKIWVDQSRRDIIKTTLTRELKRMPSIDYHSSIYDDEEDKIYVIADVYSPRTVTPPLVSKLQDKLEEQLGKPTELTVRTSLVHTVSALDNRTQIVNINLDGDFVDENPDKLVLQTKQADTILRNQFSDLPGTEVKYVRIFKGEDHVGVVASVEGLLVPRPEEIRRVEALLEEELEEPDIKLIVRFHKAELYSGDGLYQLDISGLTDTKPEHKSLFKSIDNFIRTWFENIPDTTILSVNNGFVRGQFHCLVELSSIRVFSVNDVRRLESALNQATGKTIFLYVLSKPEVLASSKGYEPYNSFVERVLTVMRPIVRDELERLDVE